jgi:hypothetical protein
MQPRPSHPALHVRDDAQRPSGERGTAPDKHKILKNGSEISFAGGLDSRISIEVPREIRLCAHRISWNPGALNEGWDAKNSRRRGYTKPMLDQEIPAANGSNSSGWNPR